MKGLKPYKSPIKVENVKITKKVIWPTFEHPFHPKFIKKKKEEKNMRAIGTHTGSTARELTSNGGHDTEKTPFVWHVDVSTARV